MFFNSSAVGSQSHQPTHINMGKRTGRIRKLEEDIWAESHSTPPSTEFADACFSFPHTFITVREDSYVERWDDWLVQHIKATLPSGTLTPSQPGALHIRDNSPMTWSWRA